jgi:hypothetical protein
MRDTTPEAAAFYRERMLALTPAARLAMAARMFSTARAFALAGIRLESERSGPGVDHEPAVVRELLFLRLYGREFNPPELERILARLRAP